MTPSEEPKSATSEEGPHRQRTSLGVWILRSALLILAVAASIAAYRWWQFHAVHESTDDAYVHGTVVTIAPQVSGREVRVAVRENEPVHKGDLLLQLAPTPFQVAVEEALAAVDMARSKLAAQQATVTYTRDYTGASVQEAKAKLAVLYKQLQSLDAELPEESEQLDAAASRREKAVKDLKRLTYLIGKGVTSQETVDAAKTAFDEADSEFNVAKALSSPRIRRSKQPVSRPTRSRQKSPGRLQARSRAASRSTRQTSQKHNWSKLSPNSIVLSSISPTRRSGLLWKVTSGRRMSK